MSKQLVVYDKDSGVISQIMIFGQNTDIKIDELKLNEKYDLSKTDFLIEESSTFINIKRARVVNGKIEQIKEKTKTPINIKSKEEQLFNEVEYRKLPERVALITPWNQECGISNYSKDLVDQLKCQVTIFCEKNDNPEYNNPRIKVIPCWTNKDTSYGYLVELLKKNKIDIAHVQYNHDLMNAGQLKFFGTDCKEAGIKTIMTLHSPKGGVDIFGKCFDILITHSELAAKDLIGENARSEQVKIFPIGSQPIIIKDKRVACIEKSIDSKRPIIANFGFLLPQKGIKEQLKALKIIKQQKSDILLLVVCAIHKVQNENLSKKYYFECQQLVEELDLLNNVLFFTEYLPYQEVFNYLQCADLIVLPYINSAAQATSSAGRTALATGRPVLTTNVDIFEDLKTIVPQIDSRNIDDLAVSILELLDNKDKQQTIINKIAWFVERTSWKNVAKKHEQIYKSFGDIKIDIEGQVYSYFSASVVNRNLACALDELGVDVCLKSINLAENQSYDLGDNSKKLLEKMPKNVIHVRHQYPPNFSDYNGRTKILYLQVETSVPEEWIEQIERSDIDYIWVYTNHAKELVRKSKITKPVEVIKCGFDPELFNEKVIPINLSEIRDSYTKRTLDINEKTFVFMFIGHAQERKNFKAIFKAYLSEFTQNDNILLVVKSYDGGEVHNIISELIDYVSMSTGRSKLLLPKHLYIYEDTPPHILPTYYKAANVLCQCSRAEGFGKPIVEAMGMGIPSISVLWSGPKDFCTEKNSFPIPFKLVTSTYHVQSNVSSSVWAEIDLDDLKKVMRFCFENPDEVKKRGQQALLDSANWTIEESAFDVIDFVRKYGL